jgi:hypothetical protein
MNRLARSMTGVVAAGLVLSMAGAAAADPQEQAPGGQASRAAQGQQGPLVLQPISSGFVFTPEVKFTTVNHSYGTLFGASGGWLYDESLFFGAGVYWLVGGAHDAQMTYGGFITGWSTPVGGALRVGVRGLFGWGHSEMIQDVAYPVYCHPGQYNCSGSGGSQKAWVYQNFMVFEPEGTATVRLGKKLAIDFAGGYRLTGNNYYGWDNHISGGFGSFGIRFGPF